jgi:transketolase
MRQRFTRVTTEALDTDPRLAVVLADIGDEAFELAGARLRHPHRLINVGIREQLMISVAGGLAQEGMRPVVHSYAPFLVERPFEQIKLDLGHQDVGALLVSTGASYDASAEGRTHQAPGDVALLATLPGFSIHVPGHPDEVEELLRREFVRDGRAYVRLTGETNAESRPVEEVTVVRAGRPGDPLILAVGPTLDPVLAATADLSVTVAYLSTVVPFPAGEVRALASGSAVAIVEPYLAGTSAAALADALRDEPRRLLTLGVPPIELRRYGTPEEHRRAYGLDAAGIRRSLDALGAGGGRLVRRHHDSGARDLAVDELQPGRDSAVGEQPLPRTEHEREDPQPVGVDQVVPQECLDEIPAAMHLQLGAIPLLECRDALGHVAVDQYRVAPLQRGPAARRDVLGGVVQLLGARIVSGVRPEPGEDVVGLAAEHQIERHTHRLAHDLAHLLVPVVHGPAPVRELPAVVLPGPARRLNDPVERHERAHDQLSHVPCPLDRIPGAGRAHRASDGRAE